MRISMLAVTSEVVPKDRKARAAATMRAPTAENDLARSIVEEESHGGGMASAMHCMTAPVRLNFTLMNKPLQYIRKYR